MNDPILYLSMFLGLGGVYVLITSFQDDDGLGGISGFTAHGSQRAVKVVPITASE